MQTAKFSWWEPPQPPFINRGGFTPSPCPHPHPPLMYYSAPPPHPTPSGRPSGSTPGKDQQDIKSICSQVALFARVGILHWFMQILSSTA